MVVVVKIRSNWYTVVTKMASYVQSQLQKVKPTAKNVIEKYKEVFEQAMKELKDPEEVRQGLEAFLAASETTRVYSSHRVRHPISPHYGQFKLKVTTPSPYTVTPL